MDDSGQSTVEFAVVASAFLIVALGIWALAGAALGGTLVEFATEGAANVIGTTAEGVLYVLMF